MEGRPEVSLPTRESALKTLDALGLSGDFRIDSLPGSYSNFTHLVTLADDEARKIVLRRWQPVEPRFAHTDYWSGNILWQDGEISAVVDWEEAGYGHPAADVAYCRMEYFLEGLPDAAEEFLRVYENAAGWKVTDLPLFELAASARVMTDPPGWFTRPRMEARFRRFVANANAGLLAG